jgi:hypothetical protein
MANWLTVRCTKNPQLLHIITSPASRAAKKVDRLLIALTYFAAKLQQKMITHPGFFFHQR